MTRYNFFSRCTWPMCLERQTGFSIIAAIFLLVVLALLAAFIASVTGMQQSSGQLDVLGVRAYQSARAEHGASTIGLSLAPDSARLEQVQGPDRGNPALLVRIRRCGTRCACG